MSLILNGTDGLSDVDGTAGTPAIRGTDANTGIFFPAADTIAFAEGGAEVARFDSSGNLGIGTSSPDAKLEVTIGDNGGINIEQSGASQTGYLTFRDSDGGLDGRVSYDHSNNSMRFATATTERMRIASDGSVYIGVTSLPSAGSGGAGFRADSNGRKNLYLSTSVTANNDLISFSNPNGNVGAILTNGSATTYSTSSDYRLKENIAPMRGALATVQALKPVTYTWKVDGSNGQGFIAHELAEVVPDCVSGEKDAVDTYTDEDGNEQTRIKPQGVDTSFLVATLTAAIQELKAIVDAQAIEIAELKAK